MIDVQKNKKQERVKNVLFIITTDGYENASKEYSYKVMNSENSNCRVNGVVDTSWKSRVEQDYEMRK